jgi:two-component system, LuxR family, sensor kinase FixL
VRHGSLERERVYRSQSTAEQRVAARCRSPFHAPADGEGNFRALADNVACGILIVDAQTRTRFANRVARRILGYTARNIVRTKMRDLVGPRDYRILQCRNHTRLQECTVRDDYAVRVRRPDGTWVWIEVWGARTQWKGEPATVVMLQDITRRRSVEQAILEAANRTQRRVGRDLHDTLGQQLTGITYMTQALAGQLRRLRQRPATIALSRIEHELREAIDHVRRIAEGLTPLGPESHELSRALEKMAKGIQHTFGIECRVRLRGQCEVADHHTADHVYCIAREAVTNAVQHARPHCIEITLDEARTEMVLRVQDDGCGIARQRASTGMGLRIMQYRAELIGGALIVQRRRAGGTEVACTFDARRVAAPATEPGDAKKKGGR